MNDRTQTDGTDVSGASKRVSRRSVLKAVGSGAVALGAGTGFVGNGAAGIAAFEDLSVNSANRIVDESGETFVMRGLNVVDPRRLHVTRPIRGKTATQVVDLVTNDARGWHPSVVRVPAQPTDIGGHPNGNRGPIWEESELANPDAVRSADGDITRRKQQPPQPVAFTENELRSYLRNHYDPVVQRCKERGVYCIVDYHRHWHEQPPGTKDPTGHENHVPYDSPYTNYWAYNTYSGDNVEFGTDAPASFQWVDGKYINEGTPNYDSWAGIETERDVPGTPYAYDMWEVNADLLAETLLFWDVVAERYADEPHVIFEPYNEPTAPGIWGPADGCGAVKQEPLWRTFQEDFAAPILDEIREHAPEKLLLVGSPSWSMATQALHWNDWTDLGYEDVAVTWHNYGRHDVSQVHNWLNDTEYESPSEIEQKTGQSLENPYLEPPDSVSSQACWGWEGYEAQGLQNAMEYHPVAVTEFGWRPQERRSGWIRYANPQVQYTTSDYGEPFVDAMESDDRISWVAFCADPRWQPAMFDVPWTLAESELSLTNGNLYHPDSEIPTKCEDLPCEWTLRGDPHSGEYLKQVLAEKRDEDVPFETTPIGATRTTTETTSATETGTATTTARTETTATTRPTTIYEDFTPERVGPNTAFPADPDQDGLYEDVNGNARQDIADAVDLFRHRNDVDATYFDFTESGGVSIGDAVSLFRENTG